MCMEEHYFKHYTTKIWVYYFTTLSFPTGKALSVVYSRYRMSNFTQFPVLGRKPCESNNEARQHSVKN